MTRHGAMTLARFRSRYQGLHYIIGGRSVLFHEGQYSTTDPQLIAVLREQCRTEARGNRACWEVDAAGDPVPAAVDPFAAAVPPPVPQEMRPRAHPSPPDNTTPTSEPAASSDDGGAGVARAIAAADAVAGQPIGRS